MRNCQRPNTTEKPAGKALDLVPAALAYLARYPASTAHLRQILQRKADRRIARWETQPPPATVATAVETAIARATALGLLNDADYAATQAQAYRRRGESVTKIKARLLAKGLEADDIAAALAQIDGDEEAAAIRLAKRKRLGPYRLRAGKPDQQQRDIAALCRAGFPLRVARAVIQG